jgi:hypothetical protein
MNALGICPRVISDEALYGQTSRKRESSASTSPRSLFRLWVLGT